MAKETVLATDTNVLMQRSRFVHKDLSRPDGHPSGVVYGTIESIISLLGRFEPDYFIPVFDVGKSKFRTEISGDYKGNRGKKDVSLVSQFSATRGILAALGFPVYYEKDVEADDLLAKLAIKHSKNKQVTICTQDHDIFQLASDNVTIFRPKMGGRKEEFVTGDSFAIDLGLPAHRAPEIWAITGDAGDNIPGIPRVGGKTAQKYVLKHGSLQHAIANEPKLHPYADQCNRNYKLIKLDGTVATKEPEFRRVKDIKDNMYGNEDVMEFFEQWGMQKFLNRYISETLFE